MNVENAWNIHKDVWAYHKKYIDIQNDEKFLKTMISEKDELIKKYQGNSFATEMIFVVFKSLIKSWKRKFATQE